MDSKLKSILTYSRKSGYSILFSCLLILLANLDNALKVGLAANSDENPIVPSFLVVPVMNFLKTMKFS